MKFYIVLSLALLSALSANAQGVDRAVTVEVNRLDQRLNRLESTNTQLMQDVRDLQRANEKLMKDNAKLTEQMNTALDRFQKLDNIDLANLKAGQAQNQGKITEAWESMQRSLEADRSALQANMENLDWGSQQRDCAGVGKHQQIQNTTSPDGSRTVRHLCFDGRLIHLETSLNNPPL